MAAAAAVYAGTTHTNADNYMYVCARAQVVEYSCRVLGSEAASHRNRR